VSFLQHPDTTEDLTAVWKQAGGTPLGQSSTVAVPPGQTLVAFLVGTDLYGIAGTTGGTCTADTGGRTLDLGWPVQLNWSLTDVLNDGQQIVAMQEISRQSVAAIAEIQATINEIDRVASAMSAAVEQQSAKTRGNFPQHG
jgi:hypothetical protein